MYSSEEERCKELKDKVLTVVPWNCEKQLILTDPNKSVSQCIYQYAKELGLTDKTYEISGISYPVKFTNEIYKKVA